MSTIASAEMNSTTTPIVSVAPVVSEQPASVAPDVASVVPVSQTPTSRASQAQEQQEEQKKKEDERCRWLRELNDFDGLGEGGAMIFNNETGGGMVTVPEANLEMRMPEGVSMTEGKSVIEGTSVIDSGMLSNMSSVPVSPASASDSKQIDARVDLDCFSLNCQNVAGSNAGNTTGENNVGNATGQNTTGNTIGNANVRTSGNVLLPPIPTSRNSWNKKHTRKAFQASLSDWPSSSESDSGTV